MKLLIATDHRFVESGEGICDSYCFDRMFFSDYLRVFTDVTVLARVIRPATVPCNLRRSDDTHVRFVPVPDIRGLRWVFLRSQELKRLVAAQVAQADALIARVPSQLGILASSLAFKAKRPYMAEVVGDPASAIAGLGTSPIFRYLGQFQSLRLRGLVKRATCGSYVSSYVLPKAYPFAVGAPSDIISSIRLPRAMLSSPRKYLTAPSPLRLIMVASFYKYKRHRDLILACRNIINFGLNVEVNLIGDGPEQSSIRGFVRNVNLSSAVHFHGHIHDREILTRLYDTNDICALPSESEGLPRVLIEAMARGVPVIGARAGGIQELVRNSELFSVGAVQELAALITSVGRDVPRLQAMSSHSIKTAINYCQETLSPKRDRLYGYLRDVAGRT